MSRTVTLLGLTLALSALAAGSALARGAGRGGKPRPPVGEIPIDPQEPIEWLTDYDEACQQAADKNQAILILVTNEETERSVKACNFAANSVRRAVRDAKVIPLKLRPPVALDTARLPAEEARQRQEAFKKSRERYEALVKSMGATTAPSLVYAAPDAARLITQSSPTDQDIIAALARLPEMVKAHQEAAAKGKNDPKPDPTPTGGPAKPPAGKEPGAGTKPEGGPDDF
jgi:hypothetical protein